MIVAVVCSVSRKRPTSAPITPAFSFHVAPLVSAPKKRAGSSTSSSEVKPSSQTASIGTVSGSQCAGHHVADVGPLRVDPERHGLVDVAPVGDELVARHRRVAAQQRRDGDPGSGLGRAHRPVGLPARHRLGDDERGVVLGEWAERGHELGHVVTALRPGRQRQAEPAGEGSLAALPAEGRLVVLDLQAEVRVADGVEHVEQALVQADHLVISQWRRAVGRERDQYDLLHERAPSPSPAVRPCSRRRR